MSRRSRSALIIALVSLACTNEEASKLLDTEIARTNDRLSSSEAELAKYGAGSALHALVSLRISIDRQTLSMLEQKKVAAWYYPRFSYTVDGSAYSPPVDRDERIASLESDLGTAAQEVDRARSRAEGARGLVGALAAMELETKKLAVSQIEYQLTALRNEFPPYLAANDQAPSSTGHSNPGYEVSASIPSATEKSAIQEAMQSAVRVELIEKTYRPSNARAGKYDDTLELALEYSNNSGEDIRAFTGTVVFKDIFERPFLRVSLTVDDPISDGRTVLDRAKSLDINKFNDDHKQLVATDLEDLRIEFEVESIIFSDGSKMGSVR